MTAKPKAKKKKRSRRNPAATKAMKNAFGLWSDREIDSLKYQRKLREEWDR
jgi:hypothetical protein